MKFQRAERERKQKQRDTQGEEALEEGGQEEEEQRSPQPEQHPLDLIEETGAVSWAGRLSASRRVRTDEDEEQ